jgi:hypothetical protein
MSSKKGGAGDGPSLQKKSEGVAVRFGRLSGLIDNGYVEVRFPLILILLLLQPIWRHGICFTRSVRGWKLNREPAAIASFS